MKRRAKKFWFWIAMAWAVMCLLFAWDVFKADLKSTTVVVCFALMQISILKMDIEEMKDNA